MNNKENFRICGPRATKSNRSLNPSCPWRRLSFKQYPWAVIDIIKTNIIVFGAQWGYDLNFWPSMLWLHSTGHFLISIDRILYFKIVQKVEEIWHDEKFLWSYLSDHSCHGNHSLDTYVTCWLLFRMLHSTYLDISPWNHERERLCCISIFYIWHWP